MTAEDGMTLLSAVVMVAQMSSCWLLVASTFDRRRKLLDNITKTTVAHMSKGKTRDEDDKESVTFLSILHFLCLNLVNSNNKITQKEKRF